MPGILGDGTRWPANRQDGRRLPVTMVRAGGRSELCGGNGVAIARPLVTGIWGWIVKGDAHAEWARLFGRTCACPDCNGGSTHRYRQVLATHPTGNEGDDYHQKADDPDDGGTGHDSLDGPWHVGVDAVVVSAASLTLTPAANSTHNDSTFRYPHSSLVILAWATRLITPPHRLTGLNCAEAAARERRHRPRQE